MYVQRCVINLPYLRGCIIGGKDYGVMKVYGQSEKYKVKNILIKSGLGIALHA